MDKRTYCSEPSISFKLPGGRPVGYLQSVTRNNRETSPASGRVEALNLGPLPGLQHQRPKPLNHAASKKILCSRQRKDKVVLGCCMEGRGWGEEGQVITGLDWYVLFVRVTFGRLFAFSAIWVSKRGQILTSSVWIWTCITFVPLLLFKAIGSVIKTKSNLGHREHKILLSRERVNKGTKRMNSLPVSPVVIS